MCPGNFSTPTPECKLGRNKVPSVENSLGAARLKVYQTIAQTMAASVQNGAARPHFYQSIAFWPEPPILYGQDESFRFVPAIAVVVLCILLDVQRMTIPVVVLCFLLDVQRMTILLVPY